MPHDVISTCPVCSGDLTVTRLHCASCGTIARGRVQRRALRPAEPRPAGAPRELPPIARQPARDGARARDQLPDRPGPGRWARPGARPGRGRPVGGETGTTSRMDGGPTAEDAGGRPPGDPRTPRAPRDRCGGRRGRDPRSREERTMTTLSREMIEHDIGDQGRLAIRGHDGAVDLRCRRRDGGPDPGRRGRARSRTTTGFGANPDSLELTADRAHGRFAMLRANRRCQPIQVAVPRGTRVRIETAAGTIRAEGSPATSTTGPSPATSDVATTGTGRRRDRVGTQARSGPTRSSRRREPCRATWTSTVADDRRPPGPDDER